MILFRRKEKNLINAKQMYYSLANNVAFMKRAIEKLTPEEKQRVKATFGKSFEQITDELDSVLHAMQFAMDNCDIDSMMPEKVKEEFTHRIRVLNRSLLKVIENKDL